MAAPSKLDAALLAKLDQIADEGLTLAEVCNKLGIGITTWRRWEANESNVEFRSMAARVRAGMGSATDDLAWGVLREVAEDTTCRPSDRLAAAQAILRLRTAHKIEVSGSMDIVTLARLAEQDAS